MKRLQADAAVVGAGIIGASVAYHLALRHMRVVVVEARYPASGASGACNGGLSYIGKLPALLDPAVVSLRRYQGLEAELQADLECDQGRSVIYACRHSEDVAAVEPLVELCRSRGLDARLVPGTVARELEPLLSPSVTWAAVANGRLQGTVNPFAVTRAFLGAAIARGAELHRGEVHALSVTSGAVTGVAGEGWELSSPLVVVANGVKAPTLVPQLPVIPCKGVVLVTERCGLTLKGNILSAGYLASEHGNAVHGQTSVGLAVEQTASGNILIGSSRSIGDGSERVPPGMAEALAANALCYLPSLSRVKVIRTFAGVRPRTPDNLPLLGPVGPDGLYAAAGFEGTGITLAPWAGELTARLIMGEGELDHRLAARRFSP